jgi:general secretion pathway protein J
MHIGEAGFTLLELLIAMTLTSFVALLLFGGVRLGTRTWERTDRTVARTDEIASAQSILRYEMERIYPAYAEKAGFGGSVIFSGEIDRMSFLAPLPANFGPGEFVRVTVAVDAQNGLKNLVMSWQANRAAFGAGSKSLPTPEIVLMHRVDGIKFAYFGPDVESREVSWQPLWDGRRSLPQIIRLTIAFPPSDPRTVPPMTVHPRLDIDTTCSFDPVSKTCRGRI